MSATATVILTAEDRTKAAFASLKSNVGGVTSYLGGLKTQLLALAGVAGFGALVVSAIRAGDEVAKLSQKLGASTEALSQYRHVAELSNVAFESLTKGWQLMEKNVSLATQGIGPAKDALKELGLSASDLKKLKPEAQFEILADAMEQVKNPADKVRLAMQVFGKAGADLIPVMQGGSAAIRAAREEADRLGLTLDQAAARDMEEANDAMMRLKSAFLGVANTLAVQFGPALATIAEWLSQNLPAAVNVTVKAFIRLKEIVALALSTIFSAMGTLFSLLAKLPGDVGQTFKDGADAADQFTKKMFDTVSGYEKQLDDMNIKEKQHYTAVQQTSKTYTELYNPALQAMTEQKKKAREHTAKLTDTEKAYKKELEDGKQLTEDLRTPQETYADNIQKINKLLADGVITQETYNRALLKYQKDLSDSSGVTKALEDQKKITEDHVKQMADIFKNGFFALMNDGFDGMVKSFENALASMAADAASNEISQMLFGGVGSSAGKGESSLFSDIFGGIGSFFGFGGFKAAGGPVLAGKGYIVGENGPEYFLPKQSGNIIPNDQMTQKNSGSTIVMNISTPDANSFRRSSGQIISEMGVAIQRAVRRNT
ncbi:MAG: hypothetical protein SFW66_07810 [Gammaproteobacteria bacterium]|nr:hypothetical protein [Gammaproteobacteria bacterium]